MELDRKDLIDFAADVTLYVEKIGIAKVIDNFIERKSIKSEAQNETPNVNNNEQKENNCRNHKCVWNVFTSNRCGAKDVKLCPYRQL